MSRENGCYSRDPLGLRRNLYPKVTVGARLCPVFLSVLHSHLSSSYSSLTWGSLPVVQDLLQMVLWVSLLGLLLGVAMLQEVEQHYSCIGVAL